MLSVHFLSLSQEIPLRQIRDIVLKLNGESKDIFKRTPETVCPIRAGLSPEFSFHTWAMRDACHNCTLSVRFWGGGGGGGGGSMQDMTCRVFLLTAHQHQRRLLSSLFHPEIFICFLFFFSFASVMWKNNHQHPHSLLHWISCWFLISAHSGIIWSFYSGLAEKVRSLTKTTWRHYASGQWLSPDAEA